MFVRATISILSFTIGPVYHGVDVLTHYYFDQNGIADINFIIFPSIFTTSLILVLVVDLSIVCSQHFGLCSFLSYPFVFQKHRIHIIRFVL